MRNVGEIIYSPIEGESEEQYEARVEEADKIFKNALGNQAGLDLLRLLSGASPPIAPRFLSGGTDTEAAFLDGEKHLIGLLISKSGHNT